MRELPLGGGECRGTNQHKQSGRERKHLGEKNMGFGQQGVTAGIEGGAGGKKPTAPGIPRWSPIQVLTKPNPV